MNNKQFWITGSLVNLCVVALLGFILRSKILFPLHFINFQNLLNAHAHFAFGGWVTLAFLNLFTHTILPLQFRQRAWYQWMLWGLLITSLGMLFSFPFQGYGLVAIIFSTLFIFFTYGYCWAFARDLLSLRQYGPASVLGLAACICLVISSAGPFALAYMLATRSGNAILYKDAIYFYLHFQYNGFFQLSVFALLFFARYHAGTPSPAPPVIRWFIRLLIAAVIPSFFLSLLWHAYDPLVRVLAFVGALLIMGYLVCFFLLFRAFPARQTFNNTLANRLCFLALVSFVIKSVLQIGTFFPDLGNAVFGLRPVIIGFLHLVFLGLTTFFILSDYIAEGALDVKVRFVKWSVVTFSAAVILQETILLIQGVGLLFGNSDPVYNWLLWYSSIFLLTGALLIFISRLKSR